MSETRLAVNDVSVEFTGLRALDHVSLSVSTGEVVGLIGPNGSGKTTLINAITGQVKLAGGTITAGDTTLSGLSPREIALAGVSRSFQIVRLFNTMTVLENVEAAALAKGASRAVATEPEIIFFDEPTTGLDPIMADVINNLIRQCESDLGATALSITHDMASVRRIADRVAMIHEGRIIWTGAAADIDRSGNEYVEQFIHGRAEGPIKMPVRPL